MVSYALNSDRGRPDSRAPRQDRMSALANKRCKPCEGNVTPLEPRRARELLAEVAGWRIDAEGSGINREFQFRDFHETMAFINALAWVSNQQGHHPDFEAGWGYCRVRFTTHAIGGLSENDFICASRINALRGG